jgi:hypothetical protein
VLEGVCYPGRNDLEVSASKKVGYTRRGEEYFVVDVDVKQPRLRGRR